MNREILFRGETKGNVNIKDGVWVFGLPFYINGVIGGIETAGGKLLYVDPETVGQYIYLTDKNGTKIFEGDIVRCYGGESCQGFWEYDEIVVVNIADYIAILTISELEYIEVIGNKWDNPELLKGE